MNPDAITWLMNASPAVVYLMGVVILFLRLEATNKTHIAKMEALIERYHQQVGEQIHTLALLDEKLERHA